MRYSNRTVEGGVHCADCDAFFYTGYLRDIDNRPRCKACYDAFMDADIKPSRILNVYKFWHTGPRGGKSIRWIAFDQTGHTPVPLAKTKNKLMAWIQKVLIDRKLGQRLRVNFHTLDGVASRSEVAAHIADLEQRQIDCEHCNGTGLKHTQDGTMLDDPCPECGG